MCSAAAAERQSPAGMVWSVDQSPAAMVFIIIISFGSWLVSRRCTTAPLVAIAASLLLLLLPRRLRRWRLPLWLQKADAGYWMTRMFVQSYFSAAAAFLSLLQFRLLLLHLKLTSQLPLHSLAFCFTHKSHKILRYLTVDVLFAVSAIILFHESASW